MAKEKTTLQDFKDAEHATRVLLVLKSKARKDFWINWPVMPMENKTEDKLGFIVDLGDVDEIGIFEGNMFLDLWGATVESVMKLPYNEYKSVSEVMDAGWLVN